jgi:hypothetical protein
MMTILKYIDMNNCIRLGLELGVGLELGLGLGLTESCPERRGGQKLSIYGEIVSLSRPTRLSGWPF